MGPLFEVCSLLCGILCGQQSGFKSPDCCWREKGVAELFAVCTFQRWWTSDSSYCRLRWLLSNRTFVVAELLFSRRKLRNGGNFGLGPASGATFVSNCCPLFIQENWKYLDWWVYQHLRCYPICHLKYRNQYSNLLLIFHLSHPTPQFNM